MAAQALLVGGGEAAPVSRGGTLPYAHFDHAASTPPFVRALDTVRDAAARYASVHRGGGWKSRRTTVAFEEARARVALRVGADPSQVVVFVRNTTEALNQLARRIVVPAGHVVVVTGMEHHSNDLPWRRAGAVVRAGVDAAGRVDEDQLRGLLRAHAGRVAALAVTAASNVTGLVNPVHRWARWAHEAGAPIVVDAAQLVPHRPLDCRPATDPEHLDAVAFSAHKCYAPFGVGVLVAPRAVLGAGEPAVVGGGAIDVVGDDYVSWTAPPAREEAGTPCALGVLALAEALDVLAEFGWDAVAAHEGAPAALLDQHLRAVPGLTLYGDAEPCDPEHRLGVFAFTLDALPHGLVAAALDHEWGIGVRNGCFCAHPYVKALLHLSAGAIDAFETRVRSGDRRGQPGMVRASVGLAATRDDAARLVTALASIAGGGHEAYVEALDGVWTPAT